MDFLENSKQFIAEYYPKDHLYLAGSLSVLIIIFLALTNEEANYLSSSQSKKISIPISSAQTDGLEQTATDTSAIQNRRPLKEQTQPSNSWQNFTIKSGDNLSNIFSKVGLTDQDLFRVLNSSKEAQILNEIYPGYELGFFVQSSGDLEKLLVLKNPLEGFIFNRGDNGYKVERITKEAQLLPTFKVGIIKDSLLLAGQEERIPDAHLMEMANIFGGVIDFILDPREGDRFSILYNEEYLDGDLIGHDDILVTQFVNQGEIFTAVRYVNEEGELGYYSPDGESMRKAFLRNPLDVFRISSNFNPRRRHPILNTIRAHKGTDYAAPTGTPIRATSEGRITRASRYGSFGNLVIIQHSGGFETKYAHLSRFASGISRGSRVRQGDIIGYVGSTGGATGPHLHYEFLVSGVHQNPRTILDKLPKAESINRDEMALFKKETGKLLSQFEELSNSRIFNSQSK